MTRRAFPVLLLAAAFASLSQGRAEAAKIKVGSPGAETIQAAIDLALQNTDPDDTILIPPSVYDESVFVTLTGSVQETLTLERKGKGEVRIRGVGSNPAVRVVDAAGVKLKNLTLESGSAADGVAALEISGSVVGLVAEKIKGVPGDDFGVAIVGTEPQGVLLQKCDFSGMQTIGFRIDGSRHRLEGCTANACGENALVFAPTSSRCRVRNFKASSQLGQGAIETGVVTVRGADHHLGKCTVSGGGDDGFLVDGDGHVLSDCTSNDNVGAAFEVLDAAVLLEGCVGGDSLVGFAGGGDGCVVRGGAFSGNASHGLWLFEDGTVVDSVKAEKNGGQGALIMNGASGIDVVFSTFKKNAGEGVRVEGSGCWIESNTGKKGDGFVDAGAGNAGRGNTTSGQNDFP